MSGVDERLILHTTNKMLFNSQIFAVFFILFFIIYWSINSKGVKVRNVFILISSIIFYGWWDWRFVLLIGLSSIVDFVIGLIIHNSNNNVKRKLFLILSLVVNLGLLAIFKYLNFFIESFQTICSQFNIEPSFNTLNIILPVGISFYTFQTLSYTVDIFQKKLTPTKDFIAFASFVCFFPQLVAGPIERARDLLPQFYVLNTFDYNKARKGIQQVLWGLFKKVAIADSVSPYVDEVFMNYSSLDSISILMGVFYFSLQIYCDFSGYSDIAIGISKLLGFNLSRNFKYPYFAKSINEFWHRWHISLSSWFRDYLYIPLGGSRKGKFRSFINILIVFLVSGLWHGANWTYVIWGGYHALLYLPGYFVGSIKVNLRGSKSFFTTKITSLLMILKTFILVNIGWVFFRSESISQATSLMKSFLNDFSFSISNFYFFNPFIISTIIFFTYIEWKGRNKEFGLEIDDLNPFNRKLIYVTTFCFIFLMYSPSLNSTFIYFQF